QIRMRVYRPNLRLTKLSLQFANTHQLDRTDSIAFDVDRFAVQHFNLGGIEQRTFSFFSAFLVRLEIELQNAKRIIAGGVAGIDFEETHRPVADRVNASAFRRTVRTNDLQIVEPDVTSDSDLSDRLGVFESLEQGIRAALKQRSRH